MRTIRSLAIVPALALLVAGCSANPDTADAPSPSESSPAATSTPIDDASAEAEKDAADAAAKAEAEAEAAAQAEADAAAEAEAEAAAQAAAEAAAAEEAAKGTVSQQNAYRSARSYLDFAGFSRAGLIQQLTSEYGEGYPPEDAEFAVARLEAEGGVDWNAEAAESAASYLELTGFSRQGLIQQLTSEYGEGFTLEQAEYAADAVGL
ncbi:MAG: Ltp family lipoprotein [Salana multivorans]|uniref:Ltp family lipoprotein n=1 Tax=Salana multivorans TaxID=120377 RepID=UPI0009668651|nr:Ltp family lipoprotein [Salana multivorans]MBN8883007.1 Ltp family lipoprotein [Salana multivorans]OJX94042.1 MAG: hypothetical protein BGO96_09550 [Micrococcales bacterium 73-15]